MQTTFDPTPLKPYDDLGFTGLAHGRPWMVANMVASVDGVYHLDRVGGHRLGRDADRYALERLRGRVDAVMIGAQTMRDDEYGIVDVDDPGGRIARGLRPRPLTVVVTRHGSLPAAAPLFADHADQALVVAHEQTVLPPLPGVVVERVGDERMGGGLDLRAALRRLHDAHDVGVLLVEGGPTLLGGMVARGLVDELFVTVAPLLAGRRNATGIVRALMDPSELELVWAIPAGSEVLLRYRVTDGNITHLPS